MPTLAAAVALAAFAMSGSDAAADMLKRATWVAITDPRGHVTFSEP